MNYTEFLRELAVDLQDELNQRNRDTEVTIIDVEKPWDWQVGLQISDGRNVSPIVEACPFENKDGMMSLLHSFYCWGAMGVVLGSTLFFAVFGVEKWKMVIFYI